MSLLEKIPGLFRKLFRKKQYPVYEVCSVCGERVYLPFLCEYCIKYFCAKHRLPFNHDCENIDQWEKKPVESRFGKRK